MRDNVEDKGKVKSVERRLTKTRELLEAKSRQEKKREGKVNEGKKLTEGEIRRRVKKRRGNSL